MFNYSLQKESVRLRGFCCWMERRNWAGEEKMNSSENPQITGEQVEGNRVLCSGLQQSVSSENTGSLGESSTLNQLTAKHTEIHN